MENKIVVFTADQKGLSELNRHLSEGWSIDSIKTEAVNEWEIEAELIFYLIKRNNESIMY